jgi:transcriptional regulator with XRE-family HTH domain
VVGAYERGERAISVQRLNRIASLYHVSVAALIPTPAELDANDNGVDIDLAAIDAADPSVNEAIDRFLSSIQLRRRSTDGNLTVRQSDLELLASLVRADRGAVRRVMDQLE